jgi:ribosomal protein L11 methyltransferase
MEYLKFIFSVEPVIPGNEILIAYLGDKGFESFTENENGFDAFIQKNDFKIEMLPNLNDFEGLNFSFEKEDIAAQNWNQEWEKNFSPVEVEDKILIRAPFHPKPSSSVLDIVIMPKMSFGTGHHDTTWLMCNNIFQLKLNGKCMLDMGCGTGVLAILGRKLGASRVLGIDIDDWSIENSRENCEVNGVSDIEILKGDSGILGVEKFDVIAANINRNVLMNDIPIYSSVLNNDGTLLLSGFFETDFPKLISLAENNGLTLNQSQTRNNWGILMLQK